MKFLGSADNKISTQIVLVCVRVVLYFEQSNMLNSKSERLVISTERVSSNATAIYKTVNKTVNKNNCKNVLSGEI